MKNISTDLPANLKQRCQRYLLLQNQMEWLCEEDKKLYQNQVKFNGSSGYITNKKAPLSTIHPSRRKLLKKPFNESCEPSTTVIVEAPEYDSSDGLCSANITHIENEPPKRHR